ncbi:dienelactone hydrolase family protein [Aspergillus cavernicola]|uniref:Dienelactone hydrolase family protein n=1 Tax=Aspergillus cavernicola TaxID=176166 RepID=A0ABR4HDI8_9EURO
MSSNCCLQSFAWTGTPTGRVDTIANLPSYISGNNKNAAVILISDVLGWTFPNIRLLADHYAREADVTVYVPDVFDGEVLPFEPILKGEFDKIDLPAFLERHSREKREPAIFEYARHLRAEFRKLSAIGFCYGGWAVFRLGAAEHQPPLVDCISTAHPSLLTKQDIDEVCVPTLILAPEFDPAFGVEMKLYAFESLQKRAIPLGYHFFPGQEHGSLVRGDEAKAGERESMARAKDSAVTWLKQFGK